MVIPAHNEEGFLSSAVKSAVSGMRDRGEKFELIIVENGSNDRTVQEAIGLAEAYPEVQVRQLPRANYGAALREGFLSARGEVVVNFDADLVDLGFYDAAMQAMSTTAAEVVVGSKRARGSCDQRPLPRRVVTAVYSKVLRVGFDLGVSDTHGLKALRREPLLELVRQCRFGHDIFDTELILRAERAGLAVVELPVSVDEVRPPRSSIARRIPRTLASLVRLRLVLGRSRAGNDISRST